MEQTVLECTSALHEQLAEHKKQLIKNFSTYIYDIKNIIEQIQEQYPTIVIALNRFCSQNAIAQHEQLYAHAIYDIVTHIEQTYTYTSCFDKIIDYHNELLNSTNGYLEQLSAAIIELNTKSPTFGNQLFIIYQNLQKLCQDFIVFCSITCANTLTKLQHKFEQSDENEQEEKSFVKLSKPILDYCKNQLYSNLYGQFDAKKAAFTTLIYSNLNQKRNLLLVGPSGCGKTEIFRQLQEAISHTSKIFIYDCSHIGPSGARSCETFKEVLNQMDRQHFSVEEIEHSIIVFDEFDKICMPDKGNPDWPVRIQGELLSMVEGNKIHLRPGVDVDTSHINFVFCGAFSTLYEKKRFDMKHSVGFLSTDISTHNSQIDITIDDIIEYGVLPELAGRVSSIVALEPMTKECLLQMLLSDKPLNPIIRLQNTYHIKFDIDKRYLFTLADEASRKLLGVRYLNSLLLAFVDDYLFQYGTVEHDICIRINQYGEVTYLQYDLRQNTYQPLEILNTISR